MTNLTDADSGSLRAVMGAASSGDVIEFGSLSGTITLESSLPTISSEITITGNGNVTIAGQGVSNPFRLLNVNIAGGGARTTVTISNLTFQNGDSFDLTENGGAFLIEGNVALTFSNCIFLNNIAVAGGAISIVNDAHVTITGSRFQSNQASSTSTGGAIFVQDSEVTIKKTRFIRNTAGTFGGAILVGSAASDGVATIKTSLFLQNDAGSGGGAIAVVNGGVSANLTLNRVTLFANDGDSGGVAASGAGALYASGSPTINIRNTYFSKNGKNRSISGSDFSFTTVDYCEGAGIATLGNNFSEATDADCGLSAGSSDLLSGTAGLNYSVSGSAISIDTSAPLLSTSAAVNAGSNANCSGDSDLTTDIDGTVNADTCDIGAFEYSGSGGAGSGGVSGSGGSSGSGGDSGTGGTGGSSVATSSGCSLI